MTDAEEDRATKALIEVGKAIIPGAASKDPELARWLYMGGHLDLLHPDDLEWARSVTNPEDRPANDPQRGDLS